MSIKADDPIRCPDGTWFILGALAPLYWGSSEARILAEVSERVGSVDMARELLKGGDARWQQLAERDPALHRLLTRKLRPGWQEWKPAPVVEQPRDRAREAAEAALEQRRQAAEARRLEREEAARAYEARKAQEAEEAREREEALRRRRAELREAQSEASRRAAAERKAKQAAERAAAKEAARQERAAARAAAIAAAREERRQRKPAWHEQARALRVAGHTLKEIGEVVGHSETAVALACAGIAPPTRDAQLAAEAAEVVALHQGGLTYRQIAAQLGRSLVWVQKRMDVGRPKGYRAYRGGKPKITPGQRADIRRRYEAGETTHQLAKSYGVRHNTISEAIRRAGGQLRPAGRGVAQFRAANAAQAAAEDAQAIAQWGYV